jgi:DNA/RNA-binding domain of Phe-tRNA-synthetase-like protein
MERSGVLVATDAWKSAFPGAVVAALVMRGVENPEQSAALEVRKRQLEEDLRARGARLGREGAGPAPGVRAYVDYYRAHGKTYHVKAQWESVAIKGKPLPRRAALVEAMFMAELKNLILTAGHDLTAVELPVRVDVAREEDGYVLMNGTERVPGAGDMMMVDGRASSRACFTGPTGEPASRPRRGRLSSPSMHRPGSARTPSEPISRTFARTSCSWRRTRNASCWRPCQRLEPRRRPDRPVRRRVGVVRLNSEPSVSTRNR